MAYDQLKYHLNSLLQIPFGMRARVCVHMLLNFEHSANGRTYLKFSAGNVVTVHTQNTQVREYVDDFFLTNQTFQQILIATVERKV